MRWCEFHKTLEPATDFRIRKENGYVFKKCRKAEAIEQRIRKTAARGTVPNLGDAKRPYARPFVPDPLNGEFRGWCGPVDHSPWRVSL